MNDKTLRVLEYKKIIDMLSKKTESSLGSIIAEKLRPSKKLEEVSYIQEETDEAVTLIIKRGSPPLGGIHDILGELKRAEIGSTLMPGPLLRVADTLRSARRLKGFMKESKEDKDSRYKIIEELIFSLNSYKDIEDAIFNAIISEEEISDNASPALKNIRRQIRVKNESIRNKLNSIINSSSNRKYLQDALVTIREDRFVVPVKQEYKGNFPGLVHDQSSSGATLFIEPMAVVEMNNELKELKLQEREEIERILAELTAMIGNVSEQIRSNQNTLAHLDFVFAKAKLSLDMRATKPILNAEGYTNIKKARHPLLKSNEVVPINIYLGKDFNTLVITGPNTGGKTVTLKTVGLLTLMAQSGLQIPADFNSHVGVFEDVFADIGDEQSIEQSLSTFSSHMTNIVDILTSLTDNSLVLFDELGAGTDPVEGAALAMAILTYLHGRNIRTVATTHYSELKVYALTTPGVENASVEFNVETLSPTYKLLIGVPGKSNAFEISKRLGLQDFIIDSAKALISKENIEFEDVLATIERDRRISHQDREEAQRLKLEVEKLKEELENKKLKVEKMKDDIIRQAKKEAKEILKGAKDESEEIIKNLQNISNEIEKEKNKKIQEEKDRLRQKLSDVEGQLSEGLVVKTNKKPPKDLKVGETVNVLTFNQNGTVMTKPDNDGNVMVQLGIMKVNVHISSLQRVRGAEQADTIAKSKTIMKNKSMNISNEIDLRGSNLEEALLDTDKYLDDAYIAGLKQIHIIHGKGTGVLREGINQLLKRHKHVKAHRLGNYGEGGNGVTVVELK